MAPASDGQPCADHHKELSAVHREDQSDSATAEQVQQEELPATGDFPERLKRFQERSGLSWSETARRLETYRHTVWRWANGRTLPNYQHRKALVELAESMGLGHLSQPHQGSDPGRDGPEQLTCPRILIQFEC